MSPPDTLSDTCAHREQCTSQTECDAKPSDLPNVAELGERLLRRPILDEVKGPTHGGRDVVTVVQGADGVWNWTLVVGSTGAVGAGYACSRDEAWTYAFNKRGCVAPIAPRLCGSPATDDPLGPKCERPTGHPDLHTCGSWVWTS